MFRFRKSDHLLRPADFRRVFGRRRSVSDGWLTVHGCENELERLRLGLSVSRKVGNAVARNRLRRLYREAFRLGRGDMPTGLDIVLVPRTSEEPTLRQLQEALPRLVRALAGKLVRDRRPS